MTPWPFSLPGPDFLKFYGCLSAAAFFLTCLFATRIRKAVKPVRTLPPGEKTTVYDLAYAAGGPARAVAAVLEKLSREGRVVFAEGKTLPRVLPGAPPSDWYERAVLKILETERDSVAAGAALREASIPLKSRVENLGLVAGEYPRFEAGMRAFIPVGVALLVGAVKVGVGIHRDKPVVFLAVMMWVLFIMGLVVVIGGGTRAKYLKVKPESSEAKRLAESVGGVGDPARLASSVALFGLGAMGAGALVWFNTMYPNRNGSGGCTGSGCGGDGGGCGGGCGGCGGGD